MGLNRQVVRLATCRPRCYVVEAPGGAGQRMAIERELDARAWRPVWSPAAADALVVAGSMPSELAGALDLVWSQLPGPRTRIVIDDHDDVSSALDGLRRDLADDAAQQLEARARERDAVAPWPSMVHGDMDHGDMDDSDMDDSDMDMSPGGIALAEGAEDRDGLEMDALVHPLGPLLDRWPGGLELRITLHGDVVVDAQVQRPVSWGSENRFAEVSAWDAVVTTLSLVGDERGAREARRLRSAVIDEIPVVAAHAQRLHSRLRRLATWSVLPEAVAAILLALTARDARNDELEPVSITELVQGRDLADVRLLVASHAPLLTMDGEQHEGAARG